MVTWAVTTSIFLAKSEEWVFGFGRDNVDGDDKDDNNNDGDYHNNDDNDDDDDDDDNSPISI